MNNVEIALVLGFVFMVCSTLLFVVINDVASNNNLDEQSNNIIKKYDSNFNTSIRNTTILTNFAEDNTSGSQVTYEGVDAFYRNTAEAKGSGNKFTDGWKVFVKFPLMLLTSVPFIEDNKTIGYIISLFVGLVVAFGFIALFKMWYGGNTGN